MLLSLTVCIVSETQKEIADTVINFTKTSKLTIKKDNHQLY